MEALLCITGDTKVVFKEIKKLRTYIYMSFYHGKLRLQLFQKLGSSRRTKFLSQENIGALSKRDCGDPFTEPHVYRAKNNVSNVVNSNLRVNRLLSEERMRKALNPLKISNLTETELASGNKIPTLHNEKILSTFYDDKELELSSATKQSRQKICTAVCGMLQNEVERRNHVLDKFGKTPTAREFQKLLISLRNTDKDDESILNYQRRLTEENGIYPSNRLDAFMLSDDVCFPEWVNALPYRIRDQVKYGNMGITEFDETLRIRLGRLPRDERIKEWNRVKKGREYQMAKEEILTLSELRDIRQGKRRYHWLLRKCQKRATALRRLALRKPDNFEAWPAGLVDYSQRIAFTAQHVENGLQTMGQWPLDEKQLLEARRSRVETQRQFLEGSRDQSSFIKFSVGSVGELLKAFDSKSKKFRRISRKAYAKRVNAIVHGDQDEYGRKHRKIQANASYRQKPLQSFDELELEKELGGEVTPNKPGLNHEGVSNWSNRTISWVEGMPSTRYGS